MYLLETITTLKAKRETETGMGEQEKHQDLIYKGCMHTLESQVTSVVPVVLLRAGAHEALDHFFSALYTSGSVLFPLCFPKKKSDEDENEKKQTNKQAKQNHESFTFSWQSW